VLTNTGSAQLIMRTLCLHVTARSEPGAARDSYTMAPLKVYKHEVHLGPKEDVYDIRKRHFGPATSPWPLHPANLRPSWSSSSRMNRSATASISKRTGTGLRTLPRSVRCAQPARTPSFQSASAPDRCRASRSPNAADRLVRRLPPQPGQAVQGKLYTAVTQAEPIDCRRSTGQHGRLGMGLL